MTFTVSGLDAALKDIQKQEEAEEAARKAEEERKAAEEAARKAAEEAARKAAEDAAKIPSPSGITTPSAAAKKVGPKVNKTFTVGNYKYKVAKGAFKGCKKKIKVKGASAKVRKANVKLLKKSGYKKFK